MALWEPPSSPTSPTAPNFANARHASISSVASPTTKMKYGGKRIAQIVKLRPEYVEKYKEVHAKVWPEVLKQIRQCNIEDYSIFHDETTNILFASFKYIGYDFEGDMEKMRESEKVREWWKMTDGFQESLVEGATSSESVEVPWWKPLKEVFYVA